VQWEVIIVLLDEDICDQTCACLAALEGLIGRRSDDDAALTAANASHLLTHVLDDYEVRRDELKHLTALMANDSSLSATDRGKRSPPPSSER